jgi:hypothetical protein
LQNEHAQFFGVRVEYPQKAGLPRDKVSRGSDSREKKSARAGVELEVPIFLLGFRAYHRVTEQKIVSAGQQAGRVADVGQMG